MTTAKKPSDSAAKKNVTQLQRAIVDGLEDVKAQDIQVFNTEHLSPLFERVIVASGTSNRQTKALASSVKDAVKEAGFPKPRTEGEGNGEWIIVDCGSVVAHIMQPMIRQYYRLEEMWGEMPVRMKLGAPKPKPVVKASKVKADAAEGVAAKKPGKPKAAAASDEAPAKKAVKKAAVKKITGTVAAKKPAAKKPATKLTVAPVKTVVVNKPKAASKPAVKSAAAKPAAKKPAAKRAAPKAK